MHCLAIYCPDHSRGRLRLGIDKRYSITSPIHLTTFIGRTSRASTFQASVVMESPTVNFKISMVVMLYDSLDRQRAKTLQKEPSEIPATEAVRRALPIWWDQTDSYRLV